MSGSCIYTPMAATIKKVVVVGPLQSGKSCISNFLSDYNTKPPSATYMPTVGCRRPPPPLLLPADCQILALVYPSDCNYFNLILRILEFEKEVRDGKARKKHGFEIWDVSGNRA